MRGTTKSGFAFDIEPEAIADNMELFEALTDLEAGDRRALVPVCRIVLGDQKPALYEHLRTEDGRVPTSAVMAEIGEILSAIKEGKKS